MDAIFVGNDDELTLEREQLRLVEPAENMRDEEEVDEHSEDVVSRLVFCIRPGKRCGNGAVFCFIEGSYWRDGAERGISVTGIEVGLGPWKARKQEVDARVGRWCSTTCAHLGYFWTIRDGCGARDGITVIAAVAACECNLGDPLMRVSLRTFS